MLFGGERNCRAPECAVKKWQLVLFSWLPFMLVAILPSMGTRVLSFL
jgi:hypothetical protein